MTAIRELLTGKSLSIVDCAFIVVICDAFDTGAIWPAVVLVIVWIAASEVLHKGTPR